MKKMLVADNIEMNKSILNEIFASQYEILQTNSGEVAFRFLTRYKDELSIVLINESIAQNFTPEHIETLSGMKIFENIPVILILSDESSKRRSAGNIFPYSDVVASPVNPYIIQKRVANLAELYSHKNQLEELIVKQTEKIVAQNKALKLQQKKINTINNDMLDTLSTVIEYRDVESGRHIHRIKKFTEVMLRALAKKYPEYNMTEDKISMIASASSLHDIGKIAIPDSILLSPRRLTREEFEIMKTHTVKGCELLEQLDSVEKNEYFTYCYDICRSHHEKFDGSGYPDKLHGNQIPIWAQVVSVADCYDALTSDRPYKSAFSHEQAVEMIRGGACGGFSTVIMDCFGSVINEFKKLAEEYSDVNHADRSRLSEEDVTVKVDPDADNSEDIYRKMDRQALIRALEDQKQEAAKARKGNTDVLLKMSDFVFEFDFAADSCTILKGNSNTVLSYHPKNYVETIMLLSKLCTKEYESKYIRTFRTENLYAEEENGLDRVVLECPMFIDSELMNVRSTAVPIRSAGKTEKVFFCLQKLSLEPSGGLSFSHDIDHVTGLWNFTGLRSEIEDFLSHNGSAGRHMMALIDVDGFRNINRRTGYRFGDEILRDIADMLRDNFSDNCITGRAEDDNFIVFVRDCPDKEESLTLIDNIFRRLHKTYTFNNISYPEMSACIGVATYPDHGKSFDELFENASKAVDIAKINGKNMYLFYNDNMRTSWEISTSVGTDLKDTRKTVMDFDRYFIPMTNSCEECVTEYEIIENSSEYSEDYNFDEIYSALYYNSNITAISLTSLRRMISTLHNIEEDGYVLPPITITTMFRGTDAEVAAKALREFLAFYPIRSKKICINITQDMIDTADVSSLAEFADIVRGCGFELGVYNVGLTSINTKCFTNGLFSRVTFASSFINQVAGGVIPIEILLSLAECFAGLGAVPYFPMNADKEVISQMRTRCSVTFGLYTDSFISEDKFREELSLEEEHRSYPALENERTALVISNRLYDEILEQTNSFIFEWVPRTDSVKFSASFEKMYGYMPARFDFIKNIRNNSILHEDDIKKFLDNLNIARSDVGDAECTARVYNMKINNYVWNRVHFIAIRSRTGVPTKIMAVFADISEEKITSADQEFTNGRTDAATNLYNRTATENKIKSYLFDEGSTGSHALIVAEVCGYDKLVTNLGKGFATEVLKETAENVREFFRDTDIIGRVSGDQFVIFVKGISSVEKLIDKADRICNVIDHTYKYGDGNIHLQGKIGVSMYPNDGRTYDELLKSATSALYFAKHSIEKSTAFSFDNGKMKCLTDNSSY